MLKMLWSSPAAPAFAVGNAAVAWRIADLARRGKGLRAAAVAGVGTYASFYLSSLLLPPIFDPSDSFLFDLDIGGPDWAMVVLAVGAPGILAGIAGPVLWGRWEARRFEEEPSADV